MGETDSISRQAAIDAIADTLKYEDYGFLSDELESVINNVPATDVVEVVRCKDCKHQVKEWREDKRFKDNGYWVYGCEVISDACGYWALFGQDNEFCSEAERKE